MPCFAHWFALVQKDGFNLDEVYTNLLKKVSKDIVSRSKMSTAIAEEV